MIRPTTVKPKQRNGLNVSGRRTKTWASVRAWLIPRLDKAGRVGCELRSVLPHGDCWGPIDLAHSKRRRKMEGDDIYLCIRVCRKAHEMLDLKHTHEETERIVMKVIKQKGGPILPPKE
jgi:hypothetical protein